MVREGRLPEASRASVLAGLVEREAVATTAIGHGLVVPHIYMDDIPVPGIINYQ